MQNNHHTYLKFLKIPNKVIIFIYGLLLGCILTYIADHKLWDFLTRDQDSNIASMKSKFDPFKKFDIPLNDRIQAKVRYYLQPNRKADLVECYKRSGKYLPMIRSIFEEYDLPQALVFLPILESGFKPESISAAGATGLWQIMPATASEYGLKYGLWIDERRDPEKSTIVAAELLQSFYKEFGTWDLALAAYNCGYPKLKRAMQNEKTASYWELARIPRETYDFVPSFYAILHLLANPDKYGLKLPEITEPLDYETIDLEATFTLEQIAGLANVSPGVIKSYNPALTGNIAPSGKYTIRVPVGVKENFLKQYKEKPPQRIEFTYTTYRIRKGDTLYKIARDFGTTIHAIKADNNLKNSSRIKVGQLLRVASVTVFEESDKTTEDSINMSGDSAAPLKTNQIKLIHIVERDSFSIQTLARYYAVTVDELKASNPWLRTDRLDKGEEVVFYKTADKITMHKTIRGDSLWRLARRYGTTVANLKRWNQLQGSRIHPGQRLIVRL